MPVRSGFQTEFRCLPILILGLAILFSGCSKEPEFRLNSAKLRAQEKIELGKGESYSEVHKRDIGNLLTAMFGTPNDPHFPKISEDFQDLVDLEKLRMAAGPVKSDRDGNPQGLYREHCASCHGISGNGIGPSAAILNPYPRDFRLGKFKFKQTAVNTPPSDHDLTRVIRNGVPGTGMPSFRTLSDTEVESLVDYVKYLAIRGQVERGLIKLLADLGEDERLVDLNYGFSQSTPSSDADSEGEKKTDTEAASPQEIDDKRLEQLDIVVNDVMFDLFEAWYDANESPLEIPDPPASFPVEHPDHAKLVAQGRELFFGKANCLQCHGNTGLGDGGQVNYDDWTLDWSKDTGANLQQPETYQEFLQLGVLKPRQLRPRNLRMGVFRGGNRPKDIYHRVSEGIEGTPMPATLTLTDEEKWALVAYVMNMPYEKKPYPQPGGTKSSANPK